MKAARKTKPRKTRATLGVSTERLFPSTWAERVRVIPDLVTKQPGPYRLDVCPWVRDFLDDFSEAIVVEKGAQMAWTEAALTKALFAVAVDGASVLYCFPDDSDASDFSAARFNPAIELSPELAEKFTDVSNVGHKRAGAANLWLRGMRSRAKLKSIDPRVLIRDERDEMEPGMVALSDQRVSGQVSRQTIDLSTPTYPGKGIDLEFQDTDQKHWDVPCPREGCGAEAFLDWSCVRWTDDDASTAHIVCPKCGGAWTEAERRAAISAGRWVARWPGHPRSGYRILQVSSLVLTPVDLVARFLKARLDPSQLQEFMNGLGQPFVAEGLQLTETLVSACVRDYAQEHAIDGGGCTMGVDVGAVLHYRISVRREDLRDPRGVGRRVVRTGTVLQFEDLDEFMRAFGVTTCVIDANPERRAAKAFQERWGGAAAGRVWLALYPNDPRALAHWDETESDHAGFVMIHRTEAMDLTLARFRYPADAARGLPHGTVDLPRDLPRDFSAQMCAPVRVYEEKPNGEKRAVYRENGADHYAHASLYDEIAGRRCGPIADGGVDPEPSMARSRARERFAALAGAGRNGNGSGNGNGAHGAGEDENAEEHEDDSAGRRGRSGLFAKRGLWS